MFRMWGKLFHRQRMVRDMVVEDPSGDTRTHKVLESLDKICCAFDLQHPIWLDSNVKQFQKIAKTRFTQDNFTETVSFDYLEIQVIEED